MCLFILKLYQKLGRLTHVWKQVCAAPTSIQDVESVNKAISVKGLKDFVGIPLALVLWGDSQLKVKIPKE